MTTAPEQMPTTLPRPSERLDKLKDRLTFLFPKFVPGKRVEVDPALVELRDYAKKAAAAWDEQARIADLHIRQAMGDAEVATVNGMPVLRRAIEPIKGHWVNPGEKDFFRADGFGK